MLFASKHDAALGGVLLLALIGLGILFYLAPTIIALLRGHPNMVPIMIVNLFLGWLLIGWVVALSWAFTAQERHRADYGRARRRRDEDDDDDDERPRRRRSRGPEDDFKSD